MCIVYISAWHSLRQRALDSAGCNARDATHAAIARHLRESNIECQISMTYEYCKFVCNFRRQSRVSRHSIVRNAHSVSPAEWHSRCIWTPELTAERFRKKRGSIFYMLYLQPYRRDHSSQWLVHRTGCRLQESPSASKVQPKQP